MKTTTRTRSQSVWRDRRKVRRWRTERVPKQDARSYHCCCCCCWRRHHAICCCYRRPQTGPTRHQTKQTRHRLRRLPFPSRKRAYALSSASRRPTSAAEELCDSAPARATRRERASIRRRLRRSRHRRLHSHRHHHLEPRGVSPLVVRASRVVVERNHSQHLHDQTRTRTNAANHSLPTCPCSVVRAIARAPPRRHRRHQRRSRSGQDPKALAPFRSKRWRHRQTTKMSDRTMRGVVSEAKIDEPLLESAGSSAFRAAGGALPERGASTSRWKGVRLPEAFHQGMALAGAGFGSRPDSSDYPTRARTPSRPPPHCDCLPRERRNTSGSGSETRPRAGVGTLLRSRTELRSAELGKVEEHRRLERCRCRRGLLAPCGCAWWAVRRAAGSAAAPEAAAAVSDRDGAAGPKKQIPLRHRD